MGFIRVYNSESSQQNLVQRIQTGFVKTKWRVTATLFMLSLLTIGLGACSSSAPDDLNQTTNTTNNTTNTSGNTSVVGKSSYETYCADCHGDDGNGSAIYTGLKRDIGLNDIEYIINYAMPPSNPGACEDECAHDIALYIYENFTSNLIPTSEISTGESLYNAGCASCHAENGEGVSNIPGLTRDLSIADLTTIIEFRMPVASPAACVGDCARLTAEYIFYNITIPTDVPPVAPPVINTGSEFYTAFCADCHGVDGLGVGVVIGLTRDASVAELTTLIEDTMPISETTLCTGICATETAKYIVDNFSVPVITPLPQPITGSSIYVTQCADCHGLDGRGIATITGVTRFMSLAELTNIVDTTMPASDPAACIGDCATDVAQYIFDTFTEAEPPPPPPAPVVTGESLYTSQGCAGCHGINGQGIGVVGGLTRNIPLAELANITETSMPPTDPTLCTGSCAVDLAKYIFDTFTQQSSISPATSEQPLANLPTGQVQTNIACDRMAQSGDDNVVRDAFCGATPATITSLQDLQRSLGLEFNSPNATGRGNNGRRGNPAFALTGHSTSLVAKFVNAINPRAIIFSRAGAGFVGLGFVRGDQFAEIVVRDRNRNRLSFFLVMFEQACNATNSCTNGDLLTPAVESNWTSVTLYNEEDLKNTVFDCRQCHQVGGPGTQKILRMQELRNPWNHWFRNNRIGGVALLNDFVAARGTGEVYAGIPPRLIDASEPANLEDFVVDNGFANQPNIFNSGRIQNQVINSSPAQPANNDLPGTSTTWNRLYAASSAGQFIPAPYHDVKVTDSSKLATLTQAYQSYLNGVLAPANLPDLRDAFLEPRLFEIGFAVEPGLDANGILLQACAQCHNSRLDQSLTRSRFNVNLNAMSDTVGGVLTGTARDLEIGVAIDRLQAVREDIDIMPPTLMFRDLKPEEIARVVAFLCTQTSAPVSQCQ